MRLFEITGIGLRAIAVAVALLWACIAMESTTRHHAEQDAKLVIQRLRQLRREAPPAPAPAASPTPVSHRSRPTVA